MPELPVASSSCSSYTRRGPRSTYRRQVRVVTQGRGAIVPRLRSVRRWFGCVRRLGDSASSSSAVPKPAGIVEGVETSLEAAIMLDQQLTTAFQAGLRHSLDDSDHDAMSDLSEK